MEQVCYFISKNQLGLLIHLRAVLLRRYFLLVSDSVCVTSSCSPLAFLVVVNLIIASTLPLLLSIRLELDYS